MQSIKKSVSFLAWQAKGIKKVKIYFLWFLMLLMTFSNFSMTITITLVLVFYDPQMENSLIE